MSRCAGILMPITALPSPYGIGTIGKEAYKFADFLKESGNSIWQILPVGPTSYGDSPYQSFSTYAGNPYMIDLDFLLEDGLLIEDELKDRDWGQNPEEVDYAKIYQVRFDVLLCAFKRFQSRCQKAFEFFIEENAHWVNDYALYMAVKKYFGMRSWTEWPDEDIRMRKPEAMKKYEEQLKFDVRFWKFTQYMFYTQWEKLRGYVNGLGIKLVGDMPIYVAMDSADVWANPEVFWLNEKYAPVCVAGCPPDYFSETGQLWGNPLYDWKYLKETGYKWWFNRIASAQKLFDTTRIDHFRAFDSYYAIPFPAENAINGEWMEGPGIEFFELMKKELGDVPIIAEDLGFLTPGVHKLLKDSGYPGMKVLGFAFDSNEENDYLPHNYSSKNFIVYTGTHDNDTMMGWFEQASPKDAEFAVNYCKLDKEEGYHWGMMRTAFASICDYAIIQMQDVLGLGSEARFNIPSTLGGNWVWRIKDNALTKEIADRLRKMIKTYGRLEEKKPMSENKMMTTLQSIAQSTYCKKVEELSAAELHLALGRAMMAEISERWEKSKENHSKNRRAYYLSAEFLMGRMMYNNLYCMDVLKETKALLEEKGIDINEFEEIDDAALGNGGLGRLAACFLDSAATQDVPLDGYGIRYKYGLFKQGIEDGFQVEYADDWQRFDDPWCIRREEDTVLVKYADQTVKAVPYDMAVIGYGTENINTLRLWQAEAVNDFNFTEFNNCNYDQSVKEKNDAENISKVLYPNDNSYEGKVLRLKQQYFFSSASLQNIIKRYKAIHGADYSNFSKHCAIQLNDTHPVISIPELIRLLTNDGVKFDEAFDIAQKTFNYTNHTVLSEALEKWSIQLVQDILPEVYAYIEKIDERLVDELTAKGWNTPLAAQSAKADEKDGKKADKEEKAPTRLDGMRIINNGVVHMAWLAIYASSHTNGVAWIHTEILKNDVLKEWYELYPSRFQNKTNGITQRRWLGLCNPELSKFITDKIGNGWIRDLSELDKLKEMANDDTITAFNAIKDEKKKQLSVFMEQKEGVYIDPSFIFDVQVKRLHEYKRQLLNAFSIMDIYFKLKSGELKNWNPTAFIFGAKAAPGYARAKAIIKYINEIAKLVNNDKDVNDKLKVLFVSNYNVSYGEKIYPAADISEQTSTAGTEASGTGNMKFMLNGAVTLGTYDGANVEIAQQAGEENEYIFGARVEDIEQLVKNKSYDAKKIYNSSPEIKKVIDTLIDGTFEDGGATGEGSFAELHQALLEGASWHQPDHYYILLDLPSYVEAKIKANNDYSDRMAFGKKCFLNTASAGKFSSDRTILEYARELWAL